jgi:hypothetical protein
MMMGLAIIGFGAPVSAVESERASGKRTETKVESNKENKEQAVQAKKCEATTVLAAKISSQFSERRATIEQKKSSRVDDLQARHQKRIEELTIKRQEWDKKREENFAKLREKAKTDEQKDAVEVYVATVKVAIAERRAKNDAAIAQFYAAAVALKQQAVVATDTQSTEVSRQVEEAINAARVQCDTGSDQGTVKQTLRSQLGTIRDNAKKAREASSVGAQVKTLTAQRRDAFAANAKAFEVSMSVAREQLLKVFAEDVTAISSERIAQ